VSEKSFLMFLSPWTADVQVGFSGWQDAKYYFVSNGSD
jgi:hypothetical protein